MFSEDFKPGEVVLIPCDRISFSYEKKTTKAALSHPCIRPRGGSSPLSTLRKRPQPLRMKPSAFKPPTKVNPSAPSPASENRKISCGGVVVVPSHMENLVETLRAKKKLSESKEVKVSELEEKLKSVEASDKDGTMAELMEKWAAAIKDTLIEMGEHPNCPRKQDGSKMSIGEIISALGIESSAVGYDIEEEDFI